MAILNKSSKLKIIKSGNYKYLYIYYRYKDNMIRLNTKHAVVDRGMTKDLLYNSSVDGYKNKNRQLVELKELVDNYIRLKHNDFYVRICQKELESILNDRFKRYYLSIARADSKFDNFTGKAIEPVEAKSTNLLDHYSDFFDLKNVELLKSQGMKHYKSLHNALIDYQKFSDKSLKLDDFNSKNAILSFRNFLTSEHPKEGQYKSKGLLGNNTIKKRISCLYRFFRHLEKNDIYKFKEEVYSVRIEGYDNDVITLNNEEIAKIYGIKTRNETWRKIIDLFVCNCYMGLRFSDLNKLEPHHFSFDAEGKCTLKITNAKTDINVQIPIVEFPLSILKAYQFKFPRFTNQHFNRELKEIFKKYKLFDENVLVKRKVINETIFSQVTKRDLISSHTCRRTFITLALKNGIPLNVIMLASGHKKVSTLQKYVALVSDYNAFIGIDKI